MNAKQQELVPAAANPPATPEPASILAIIDRAARDPNVDIDKMQRLLDMHERIAAKRAESDFNAAMNACQAAMRPIAADAENPQTRSKYASYAKLDSVLRPIYTGHGFSLSFDEADSPKAEHVRVVCYVAHTSGHTRTYHRDMPADGKGAKGGDVMTKTHAAGAAGAYGARYLLKGIFNVAVGEDDNDGNGTGGDFITAHQVADLEALISEVGANREMFLRFCKADSLAKIPARKYTHAVRALEERRK